MPISNLVQKDTIEVANTAERTGQPRGMMPQFMFNTRGYGVPRYDDLVSVRKLQETHTIQIAMDAIIKEITTTPFQIVPTVEKDEVDSATWRDIQDVIEELEDFFNGNFNQNNESFNHLMKQWLKDILAIDAGVIELVPDDEGFLSEIYIRDGATFVKNPDEYGRLPAKDSSDPAYYQFAVPQTMGFYRERNTSNDMPMYRSGSGLHYGLGSSKAKVVPFSRDELVWAEENPRSNSHYGRGRVQFVKKIAEIILFGDEVNHRYYDVNEVPEGILEAIGISQNELKRLRQYWKEDVKGQEHKLPIIGFKGEGKGSKLEFTKFRDSPRELQFIESQKWYNKLVWMVFGLNQNEVGESIDLNRSIAKEQSATVFRKTKRPLFHLTQQELNTKVLPFHRAYNRVDGKVKFKWDIESPAIEDLEREKQLTDLEKGLRTVNEIRQDRGLEPYSEWGDWPPQLINSISQTHPSWFLENYFNVEEPPEEQQPQSPFELSINNNDDKDNDDYTDSYMSNALRDIYDNKGSSEE